jgi:dihydrofolate reductase
VHAAIEGDVVFPSIADIKWVESCRKDCKASGDNPYDYSFVVLDRRVAVR